MGNASVCVCVCGDSRCFYCMKNQLTNTLKKFPYSKRIKCMLLFSPSTLLSSLTYSFENLRLYGNFFALEKSHSATCLIAHSFKEGCMCYYYLHAVTCSPAPLLLIEYGNGINYASIKISRENLSSTKCVCVSRFISIYACVRFTIKKNMITWVFLTLNAFHECMQ